MLCLPLIGIRVKEKFKNKIIAYFDVPATVIKISQGQSISGGSYVSSDIHGRVYGGGGVSGDSYEQVVFETEDGKRISFKMSMKNSVYNVGDRGLLSYGRTRGGQNRFGAFRLESGKNKQPQIEQTATSDAYIE